ncbi:HutD family protein [Ferrovibrio sp.]|uniref:HutD/Ves family protein n=1 Tax=Ferrovibrio sp. TaxID=1917215 RepID=UPI0025C3206B|nr:HutD family protein [Ferrovibrio sp.]MBX3453897.1 HutD family protein [Ferrovibrio sp.]
MGAHPRGGMKLPGMKLLRQAEQRARPWRNGLGVTWDIASQPQDTADDAFHWRVSRAAIVRDSEFSVFAGYDRWITLIQGEGGALRFHDDGETVMLRRPFLPLHFDGGRLLDFKLAAGASTVINVMLRRDCGLACDVSVVAPDSDAPPDSGDALLDDSHVLLRLDAARLLRVRFTAT